MDNGYHEKRAAARRKEDGQLQFLLTICKLAVRIKDPQSSKDVLVHGIDTIEKGGSK